MGAATVSLTATELTSMRIEAETFMPDECAILRPTEVSDGQGGFTTTWATASIVDCNMAAGPYMRFGAERVAAGQVTPVGIIFLSLPHDADVHTSDVIAWTPEGSEEAAMSIEVTQASARSQAINRRVAGKEVGDPA